MAGIIESVRRDPNNNVADVEVDVDDADDTDVDVADVEVDADDADDTDVDDTDVDVDVADVDNTITNMIIINSNNRITSSVMTMAEFVKVLGIRATHIDKGSPIYTDITDITDIKLMALKEIKEKKCPLKIRRMISPNRCEVWNVNEMTLPMGVGNIR